MNKNIKYYYNSDGILLPECQRDKSIKVGSHLCVTNCEFCASHNGVSQIVSCLYKSESINSPIENNKFETVVVPLKEYKELLEMKRKVDRFGGGVEMSNDNKVNKIPDLLPKNLGSKIVTKRKKRKKKVKK